MKKQSRPVTPDPGPLRIIETHSRGYHVCDDSRDGLTLAWFGTALSVGQGGSHEVTMTEAKANALLFVLAYELNPVRP